jgi:DNA-binding response OmpR family regulator
VSPESILVVDNDEAVRNLAERNLTSAGYSVMCESASLEAIRQMRVRPPDLVILEAMVVDRIAQSSGVEGVTLPSV